MPSKIAVLKIAGAHCFLALINSTIIHLCIHDRERTFFCCLQIPVFGNASYHDTSLYRVAQKECNVFDP